MTIQSKDNQTNIPRIVILMFFISLIIIGCSQTSISSLTPELPTLTPLATRTLRQLPDLIIRSVSVDLEKTNICEEASTNLWTYVQIENRGKASASSFIIDVNGMTKQIEAGLGAGKVINIAFPFYQSQTVVFIDALNQVFESDENNNKVSEYLPTPALSPKCIQRPTTVVNTTAPIAVLEGHTAKIWDVDFSPDGRILASGSTDNTLRLWEVNDGVLLRTMYGHPFPIRTVEFSPDGANLATGSTDGLIRVWRVSDGVLVSTLKGHAGQLVVIDYSPDGIWLASSAEDYTVRIWRAMIGKQVYVIDEGMSLINSISYSPDGNLIAWGEENGTIRVWDIDGENWSLILNKSQPARSVTFSPDGSLLAAGFADGLVNIWKISAGNLIGTLQGHTDSVSSLSFSPDGQWLISGSHDKTLRLWRTESVDDPRFAPVQILRGHSRSVNCVAISPDGKLIASGSDDHKIFLWALPDN